MVGAATTAAFSSTSAPSAAAAAVATISTGAADAATAAAAAALPGTCVGGLADAQQLWHGLRSFLALSVCVVLGALAYLGSIVITKREAIRRRLDRRPGLNSRSPIARGSGMTTSMLDQASSRIYD